MEITIPSQVQFNFEVRRHNPKLIGEKAPMSFDVCFTHAVKAVMLGHKVTAELSDYGPYCSVCGRQGSTDRLDERYEVIKTLK